MKHFTEPLTVLVNDPPDSVVESDTQSTPFHNYLRARLVGEQQTLSSEETWASIDVNQMVHDARSTFRKRARALRIGVHVVSVVRRICIANDEEKEEEDFVATVEALSGVLRGRFKGDIKLLGAEVR